MLSLQCGKATAVFVPSKDCDTATLSLKFHNVIPAGWICFSPCYMQVLFLLLYEQVRVRVVTFFSFFRVRGARNKHHGTICYSQFVKLSLYFGKGRFVCLSVRIPYIPRRDSPIFQFSCASDPWRLTPQRHRVPINLTQTLGLSQTSPPAVPCVDFSHLTGRPQSKHFWYHQAIITQ